MIVQHIHDDGHRSLPARSASLTRTTAVMVTIIVIPNNNQRSVVMTTVPPRAKREGSDNNGVIKRRMVKTKGRVLTVEMMRSTVTTTRLTRMTLQQQRTRREKQMYPQNRFKNIRPRHAAKTVEKMIVFNV